MGVPLLLRAGPESWYNVFESATSLLTRVEVIGAAASILLVLNVIVLALATSWFRRDRLNLH
jgi:hypothetical protein